MTLFSFHLAVASPWTSLGALLRPPSGARVPGLSRIECMTRMTLGAPIVSAGRVQLRYLAVFAAWEDEVGLEGFLARTGLGQTLARGWHVRMRLIRRWGHLAGFDEFAVATEPQDLDAPVVAVTVARMRLPEVPRFIHWGRPVEALVRDHPGATLATAAIRLPRTVSTFSVWRSAAEMEAMVRGHSQVPLPRRHADAMIERSRKDFHFEFTTLRFLPLGEYGSFEGQSHFTRRDYGSLRSR